MSTPRRRTAVRLGLGTLFFGAGILQAAHQETFRKLVPVQLREHQDLIQPTAQAGLFGLGASFLLPPLRPVARWGATGFLVATLPAAVGQMIHPQTTDELGFPRPVVASRVLVQLGVIAATLYATSEYEPRP